MAAENKKPETAPAKEEKVPEVKKTPEQHEITSSLVEKIDFSEAEIALIDTHLQSLEEKVKTILKNKEAKLTLTPEKLTGLRTELSEAWKWAEKVLTQAQVETIIDENDFEENPDTTSPTEYPNNTVTDQISPDVIDRAKEFVQNSVEWSGILPNNFMKKIMEFFHSIFGDKRISLDQSTMFDRQVVAAIGTMGIDIQNVPNKNDIKVMVMQKLAALGVPLEYSDRYFKYIQGGIIWPNDIPQKMRQLFDEWKAHYDSLGGSYSSDPKIALETILDFTPTKIETTSDQSAEKADAPKTNEVLIGTEKISGNPDDIAAYNSLRDTATKILGKKFDEKSLSAKEPMKSAKPEEKLGLAGKEVFIQIVDALKQAYGNDFASKLPDKVDQGTKNMLSNYTDGTSKIDAKTLTAMNDMLSKNLEFIFWYGVESLEKAIISWKNDGSIMDGESLQYNDAVADKLLESVRWHGERADDKKAWNIQKIVSEWGGYATLVSQNLSQIKNFNELKATLTTIAAVNGFMQWVPNLKTEAV